MLANSSAQIQQNNKLIQPESRGFKSAELLSLMWRVLMIQARECAAATAPQVYGFMFVVYSKSPF